MITHAASDYIVIFDNPLTLPCEATGIPHPTIHWLHNGTVFDAGTDPQVDFEPNGDLVFRKAKIRHRGRYTCVASNSAGNATQDMRVTVHSKVLP